MYVNTYLYIFANNKSLFNNFRMFKIIELCLFCLMCLYVDLSLGFITGITDCADNGKKSMNYESASQRIEIVIGS